LATAAGEEMLPLDAVARANLVFAEPAAEARPASTGRKNAPRRLPRAELREP
jgi:hypothetical protein